jgi:hypothetical protein
MCVRKKASTQVSLQASTHGPRHVCTQPRFLAITRARKQTLIEQACTKHACRKSTLHASAPSRYHTNNFAGSMKARKNACTQVRYCIKKSDRKLACTLAVLNQAIFAQKHEFTQGQLHVLTPERKHTFKQ